jgi:hypothetical protein
MNLTLDELKESKLRELFAKSGDVTIASAYYGPPHHEHKVVLVYCPGLVQAVKIDEVVVPGLRKMLGEASVITPELMSVNATMLLNRISGVGWLQDLMNSLFTGEVGVYVESAKLLYTLSLTSIPNRSPEESSTEISIKGPRDSFTESMVMNVALIRKRMKSTSLCCEVFKVGKRTHTSISMLYVEDIANPELLDNVRNKLNEIDIDGMVGFGQLEFGLTGSRFSLFPLVDYIGRPDYVLESLLRGRAALLVDGSPMAIIVPVNLTYVLNSPEDMYFPRFYVVFEQAIRLIGLFVALFFPGFYIAVTSFQFDQIPFPLLATIASMRTGLPLSGPADFFIMLMLFELFREAGLRLPKSVGQTVAVVGGLIVGNAAIQAGITGPTTLVAVAISTIAMFTVVNQSLAGYITILRIAILLLCTVFGMFGFMVSVVALVAYMSTLQSMGFSYLSTISPPSFRDLMNRIKPTSYKVTQFRPDFLKTKDKTRRKG